MVLPSIDVIGKEKVHYHVKDLNKSNIEALIFPIRIVLFSVSKLFLQREIVDLTIQESSLSVLLLSIIYLIVNPFRLSVSDTEYENVAFERTPLSFSQENRFIIESWELLKYETDKEMQIVTVSSVQYEL